MKQTIIFILFILANSMVYGQELTQTVKGKIIDTDTKKPFKHLG